MHKNIKNSGIIGYYTSYIPAIPRYIVNTLLYSLRRTLQSALQALLKSLLGKSAYRSVTKVASGSYSVIYVTISTVIRHQYTILVTSFHILSNIAKTGKMLTRLLRSHVRADMNNFSRGRVNNARVNAHKFFFSESPEQSRAFITNKTLVLRSRSLSPKRPHATSRVMQTKSPKHTIPFSNSEKGPCVYVIYSYGKYKIGMTNDIVRRMKQFKTASPIPQKLILKIDTEEYREIEKMLHKKYKDVRIRSDGEWFDLTDEDVVNIDEMFGGNNRITYFQ